ncbi:hypothetical protein [Vibrio sp. VB16]|uniref:hypothetical protein n=1 Tax=Vibrio sp. VB16 TaxID=2785746 RepID=UPI001E3AB3D5|nr:hypothetical protein [Vibrio sp. VB16]UGA56753.1 hypothetical protein IUZ65_021405 [Vibrio sp. VB16]
MKDTHKSIVILIMTALLIGCAVNPSQSKGHNFNATEPSLLSKTKAKLLLWRNQRFVSGGVFLSYFVNDQQIAEFRSGLVELDLEPGGYDITMAFPSYVASEHPVPPSEIDDSFVCNVKVEVEVEKVYSFYFDKDLSNKNMTSNCRHASGLIEGIHSSAYDATEYEPQVPLLMKRYPAEKDIAPPSPAIPDEIGDARVAALKKELAETETKLALQNQKKAEAEALALLALKQESERLAAEKLLAEKVTADRLAAEKLAAEKVLAEQIAADKVAAEKLTKSKANNTHHSGASEQILASGGGYQWKQTAAELKTLPPQLQGGYPLYNELYFYPEGYYLRFIWRLNPNSGKQENGSISNGAWQRTGNKITTQEYFWSRGNRYAYLENKYVVNNDHLERISSTHYQIRDTNYMTAGEVKEMPISKHKWIATSGDGPRLYNEYLTGEFSEYIGKATRRDLSVKEAEKKATTPYKWKDGKSIQPWQEH